MAETVQRKQLLDLPCGAGWGTSILAGGARPTGAGTGAEGFAMARPGSRESTSGGAHGSIATGADLPARGRSGPLANGFGEGERAQGMIRMGRPLNKDRHRSAHAGDGSVAER
jgi:hypothetical protein